MCEKQALKSELTQNSIDLLFPLPNQHHHLLIPFISKQNHSPCELSHKQFFHYNVHANYTQRKLLSEYNTIALPLEQTNTHKNIGQSSSASQVVTFFLQRTSYLVSDESRLLTGDLHHLLTRRIHRN